MFGDIAYTLLCFIAIVLIFAFWPTGTNIFAYLKL
jgi:cbb3-type cytochrome oxidase subunit 3